MKKIILLIPLALFSLKSLSQKGDWILGGSVGFEKQGWESNSNSSTFSTFVFNPEVAISLFETWQIGLGLIGGFENYDNGSSSPSTVKSIGPEIFSRKFFPISKRFSLFLGLNINASWQKIEDFNDSNSNSNSFGSNIDFGGSFYLSSRVKIFVSYDVLYFNRLKKEDGYEEFYGFSIKPGFGPRYPSSYANSPTLRLGLYYVFKKKTVVVDPE